MATLPVAPPAPPAPAVQPVPNPPPAYVTPPDATTEPPRATPGMANPASTYCLQRGGQLEFSTRANGADVGTCVSPGGDECEEWAFLRGSCTW
jgi:putative hemolysin